MYWNMQAPDMESPVPSKFMKNSLTLCVTELHRKDKKSLKLVNTLHQTPFVH